MTYKKLQEVDPFTGAVLVGSTLTIGSLISFFLTISNARKSIKVSPKLSKDLNKILKSNDWKVRVLPHEVPAAFVMGGKDIFLTTGILKLLTKKEVEAVMLHEAYHNKALHIYKQMFYKYPLFYLLAAAAITSTPSFILASIAFLIMVNISDILYEVLVIKRQEIKADEYAVKLGYGPELRSALKKAERYASHLSKKKKCGTICKLAQKINDVLSSHPTSKKRIEKMLKKEKELQTAIKSGSYNTIKKFVVKNFSNK